MRARLAATLTDLADADDRVVLLTADLGFMVLEPFAQRHADRFFNVGVAEANMLSMAAGLADQGFIPYCYSIATFASMRGYEQLRNGAVYHTLPVRIIGVGGGFAYGPGGRTHHALEDIAIMRAQPGLTVIAPADDDQLETAVRETATLPGPVYIRTTKESRVISELGGRFRLGRMEVIGTGTDVLLVSTAGTLEMTLEAVRVLGAQGVHASVAVMASIAPAPVADLLDLLANTRACVTVEDHYTTGGIGTVVAETLADAGMGIPLHRCAVPASMTHRAGSETWLRSAAGLTTTSIVSAARRLLRRMPDSASPTEAVHVS